MTDTRKHPIPVWIPNTDIDELDALVKAKRYATRSEAIREAIRLMLRGKLWEAPR